MYLTGHEQCTCIAMFLYVVRHQPLNLPYTHGFIRHTVEVLIKIGELYGALVMMVVIVVIVPNRYEIVAKASSVCKINCLSSRKYVT